MGLKDIALVSGFLTFATIATVSVEWEDKVYNPNATYYVGDNQTVINQKALYGVNTALNNDFSGVSSVNDLDWASSIVDGDSKESSTTGDDAWSTATMTLFALDKDKTWKETLENHYDGEWDKLKTEKAPVFHFDSSSSGKIYWPFMDTGKVVDVKPNTNCGNIQNFDSYFSSSSDGAQIKVTTQNKTTLGNNSTTEKYYTIKLSYISKTYANANQDESKSYHKVGVDSKALYYSNFSKTGDEQIIEPGGLLAFAGNTGGFASSKAEVSTTTDNSEETSETSAGTTYVKVEIFESDSKSSSGKAISFGDLYVFSESNESD